MFVHHERPGGEDKDIKHLIENSSDNDNTVNDTDVNGILAISLTSSMFQPECFDQSELNDLVCDLGLSKELAELLGSRLSKKHILKPGTMFLFIDIETRNLKDIFKKRMYLSHP